jgi:hypothetical protein
MTCGMLLRGWIKWGVDINNPRLLLSRGWGSEISFENYFSKIIFFDQ